MNYEWIIFVYKRDKSRQIFADGSSIYATYKDIDKLKNSLEKKSELFEEINMVVNQKKFQTIIINK